MALRFVERWVDKTQRALLELIANGDGVVLNMDFVAPLVIPHDCSDPIFDNVRIVCHEDTSSYQNVGIVVLSREEFESRVKISREAGTVMIVPPHSAESTGEAT